MLSGCRDAFHRAWHVAANLPRAGWIAIAAAMFAAAFALSYPQLAGVSRTESLAPAVSGPRSAISRLPEGFPKSPQRFFLPPDFARVAEDGRFLGPAGALKKEVQRGGYGRYRAGNREVEFSASDATNPGDNGRRYTIRASAIRVPEWLLLALWAGGFCALGAALVPPPREFRDRAPAMVTASLAAGLIGAGVLFPEIFAGSFMAGWALPAAWAISCGFAACARGKASAALLLGLAALPAWAAAYFYGPMVGTHDSMAVAGSIPFGDAALHARQAFDLAETGTTSVGFNGRFLFPAYFAQFLLVCGGNLAIANFLATFAALACCAALARVAAPYIHRAGASFFFLVCWFYGREFVAGVVMTEALGLAAGAVGTGLLLIGTKSKSPSLLAGGIFFLSLGMSARPGALFVLPSLVCASAVISALPRAHGSLRRGALAGILSAAAMLAGWSTNSLAQKAVFRGEVAPFQNFAFTLYGLLDGGTWGDAMRATGGSPSAAMERSITMLRESPTRLASGTLRAWGEMFGEAKLYQFGPMRWAARPTLALALFGFAAIFLWPRLRPHAIWAGFFAAGLLASIPFAPPWDAGIRPYAVTIPLQALMVAFGAAALSSLFAAAGKFLRQKNATPDAPDDTCSEPSSRPLWVAGGILLALSLAIPAARSGIGKSISLAAPDGSVRGTTRTIGAPGVSKQAFLERLSIFEIGYAEAAKPFADFSGGKIWLDSKCFETRFSNGE